MTKKVYYTLQSDLEAYPKAWCYIVYSKRGPGKTYSCLKYAYEHKIPIIYIKRTNDDVEFICTENQNGFEVSPYAPLNRDYDFDVYPKLIDKGVGGFWHYEADEPQGLPVAYALSLNAVKRVKGFEASRCGWMVFDEFIPQIGERVNRKEGELVLDLYMTISRDRQARGEPPLKLILFANAEEISTPVTNTLEVVDIIADLNASGQSHYYDKDRKILVHHITNAEVPILDIEKVGIYEAMANTSWGAKTFEGEFSRNDFSNVVKCNLKGYHGFIELEYKRHKYYIYSNNEGMYYMSASPAKCDIKYNLDRETEQRAFYLNYQIDFKEAITEERFKFQKYSMYDLIKNYKQFFDVGRW